MTIQQAKLAIGLPDAPFFTQADYEHLQAVTKEKIVAARQRGDDNEAAMFSEARAVFKKRWGFGPKCPICGETKNITTEFCQVCRPTIGGKMRHANSPNLSMGITVDFEIFHNRPIPSRTVPCACREAVLALKNGVVGDGFESSFKPPTVKAQAAKVGVKLICRCLNPDERDQKKRRYCYWRSDGLSEQEVNKLISERSKA